MKKITLVITLFTLVLSSCSGAKKTQKAIDSGDYDSAFNIAIERLNKDKVNLENKCLY